ncbi:MAG: UDP-2,3-diacylglucosamine diphosphatase [Candidatus Binataceae bacterium]
MEVGELLRLEGIRRAGPDPIHSAIRRRGGDVKSYRSIWISDLHLGTHHCQAEALLDFLLHHEAETLFLVGDIVDGWNRGSAWYWSAAQTAVAEEFRAWARRGTRVVLLPGNHDMSAELAEELLGFTFAEPELIYRTGEGRRMLVIHGHQFDRALAAGRFWQTGQGYAMAQWIHEWYGRNWDERRQRSRSLAAFLRYRVRRAVQYLTDFDDRAIFEAVHERRADGIICGHIHRPEQRLIGPVWYINDGDWVESRTALVENWDGSLQLLRWDPAGYDVEDSIMRTGIAS